MKKYLVLFFFAMAQAWLASDIITIIIQQSFTLCLILLRAIYFAAYSTAKEKLNGVLEPDSTQVHMISAGMAGNE